MPARALRAECRERLTCAQRRTLDVVPNVGKAIETKAEAVALAHRQHVTFREESLFSNYEGTWELSIPTFAPTKSVLVWIEK